MPIDMFIKIDGIKGDAQDKNHKGDIEVLTWNWGVSQSGTTHIGSGGGAGKINVQDLSFTKFIDSASTPMLQLAFSGKHIPECTLFVRKPGDQQLDFFEIKMTDCLLSSIGIASSSEEDQMIENISLNFAIVNIVYRPQKSDGSLGADKNAGWNIPKNISTV